MCISNIQHGKTGIGALAYGEETLTYGTDDVRYMVAYFVVTVCCLFGVRYHVYTYIAESTYNRTNRRRRRRVRAPSPPYHRVRFAVLYGRDWPAPSSQGVDAANR